MEQTSNLVFKTAFSEEKIYTAIHSASDSDKDLSLDPIIP